MPLIPGGTPTVAAVEPITVPAPQAVSTPPPNQRSNFGSQIAADDAKVAAKARQAQTIVHNKVPESADVKGAQATPEVTKPSHDDSSPQQPVVQETSLQQAGAGQKQATSPIIARSPTQTAAPSTP